MYFSVQKEARELREDYEVFKDVHGQTMPGLHVGSSHRDSSSAPALSGNVGRAASIALDEAEAMQNPEGPFGSGSSYVHPDTS